MTTEVGAVPPADAPAAGTPGAPAEPGAPDAAATAGDHETELHPGAKDDEHSEHSEHSEHTAQA